jgi:uncharacterized coiled-coil protein SlyX
MRPKKKPQWFRHDEGNAKELKSQLEWKISLIVRQRVAALEKKVTALEKKVAAKEKSLQEIYSWLAVHARMEPDRVKKIIQEALASPPTPKTRSIYKKNKPRLSREKKK